LLSQGELYGIEDSIADAVKLFGTQPNTPVSHPSAEKVLKMVVLSERILGDAPLARQLRRQLD
jgi:hypothetical protein